MNTKDECEKLVQAVFDLLNEYDATPVDALIVVTEVINDMVCEGINLEEMLDIIKKEIVEYHASNSKKDTVH